ncbi:transmembrane 9 superfamily member 2-like [Dysidea avara]|uniref:transmembrane 9 superfamily member 2-like n=1 Tax=Dysidea avara TaxID=196820 RepID=UPI00332F55DF
MVKLSAEVIYMSALIICASGFYVSLSSKTKYCTEEEKKGWGGECQTHLDIYANKLESPFTLQSYERSSFDFCQPKDGYQHLAENFGQVLAGDRLSLLPHKIVYKKNVTDVMLCKKNYVDPNDPKLHFLKNSIHQGYMRQWFMDDMPCYTVTNSDQPFCSKRSPIGCYVSQEGKPHDACFISAQLSERSATYLFNYVKIMIAYYREDEERDVVTRVQIQVASCEVYPCSRSSKGLNLFSQNLSITYSYSVEFVELEGVAWTHRWDYLLNNIPYTSSILGYVAGFLTLVLSVVFFILQCSLYRNVNVTTIYSQYSNDSYSKFHWKELCDDVFRPPSHIMLLSISVGTGLHLFTTVLMVLLIACFGFLSPANHGAFLITN